MAAHPVYKAAPAPAPDYSWTGCYLSAGAGYGLLDDERYVHGTATIERTDSGAKGWLGTVGGGCDYQLGGTPFGPIVIGAFGDWDPSKMLTAGSTAAVSNMRSIGCRSVVCS
jgi:outer membrane immunogenic protein